MKSIENSTFGSESIENIIQDLANDSYVEVAERYSDYFGSDPSEIFYQNACQQFSEVMREKLKEKGIDSYYVKVDIRRIVPNGKHHIALSTMDYIIDGTWQQFLDKPRNDNRTLFLRKSSLIEDLEKAGVPKDLYFLYSVSEDRKVA